MTRETKKRESETVIVMSCFVLGCAFSPPHSLGYVIANTHTDTGWVHTRRSGEGGRKHTAAQHPCASIRIRSIPPHSQVGCLIYYTHTLANGSSMQDTFFCVCENEICTMSPLHQM